MDAAHDGSCPVCGDSTPVLHGDGPYPVRPLSPERDAVTWQDFGMTGPAVHAVSVAELPTDAALLDVRESDEWVAGHAPGARHLPMSELTGRMTELPDDDPLYVVCRSGARSARVVAYLAGQGYPAVNVEGGMQSWAAQGRDVVADGDTEPQII
jgi:rhodanese-related sulfurtransferase